MIAEFLGGTLAADYGRQLAADPAGLKPDTPRDARPVKARVTPAAKAASAAVDASMAFDMVAPKKAAGTLPVANLLD